MKNEAHQALHWAHLATKNDLNAITMDTNSTVSKLASKR